MIRQAVKMTTSRYGASAFDSRGQAQPIIAAQDNGSTSFKTYMLWGLVGTISLGTLVYLGWKFVGNKISDQESKGSLSNEDPAYYAKQFKIGFDNNNWYGSDMNVIREAMIAIPSKDFFNKVADSYRRQYHKSLFQELEAKLKSTEYQEMQAIYKVKPQKTGGKNAAPIYDPYALATRIHAAVNYETMGLFWGTDLEAIKQVVREVPDQTTWDDVKSAYSAKYSLSMVEDIESDVSDFDYDLHEELAKKNIVA